MTNKHTTPNPIVTYRDEHRLTQATLAKRLGITVGALRRMEQGTLEIHEDFPNNLRIEWFKWVRDQRILAGQRYAPEKNSPRTPGFNPMLEWRLSLDLSVNRWAQIWCVAPKAIERQEKDGVSELTKTMRHALANDPWIVNMMEQRLKRHAAWVEAND